MGNAVIARQARQLYRRAASGLRIAIVSTPRSGNTWLWHLLTGLYDIPSLAAHSPLEVDWEGLPQSCVLQMHWPREGKFVQRLEEHGFRVIVMARHPLDVLISILHFSLHDRATARWLEGEGGNERPIFGAMPRSDAFRAYATGPRARALLSVTARWWNAPCCIGVRYEDLNRDPALEVYRVIEHLGAPPIRSVEQAIEAATIPKLRARWQNDQYFWLGKVGLWRALFTEQDLDGMLGSLKPFIDRLGYACSADAELSAEQADAHWVRLVWNDLVDELHELAKTKRALKETEKRLAESQAHAVGLHGRGQDLEGQLAQTTAELAAARAAESCAKADLQVVQAHATGLHRQVEALHETLSLSQQHRQWALDELEVTKRQLAPLQELGPIALGMARRMRRLSTRYPRIATAVKGVARAPAALPRGHRTLRRAARAFGQRLHSLFSF